MSKTIALITAMHSELRPLVQQLSLKSATKESAYDYDGHFNDLTIIAAISTMGVDAATAKTKTLFEHHSIDHVFIVGIAGALDTSLEIGKLLFLEAVVLEKTHREYRPENSIEHNGHGKLLTSDALKYDAEQISQLITQNVVAVDMETAAIAAVCEDHHCPFSAFRAISDHVEPDAIDYDAFHLAYPDGSPNLLAVLKYLVFKPWRLGYLIKMGIGASRAIKTAAHAAVQTIHHLQ